MHKKILFPLLLVLMLLTGSITAFAGDQSAHELAYQYYNEIFQEAGNLPEADRERVRKLANALWALQVSTIESADYGGTIEDGINVIKTATYEGYEQSMVSKYFFGIGADTNANLFAGAWQNIFQNKAQAMGMDQGNSFAALFGNGSFFSSSTTNIDDNAANVNILTWKSEAGSTALHKGQISNILKIFDTGFTDFTDIIIGISIALAIAFGGSNIVSLSMDRNSSGDALTREFFKLLLGIWVMCNYKYFALLLIRLGTLLTEAVQKIGIDGAGKTQTYQATVAIWESFKDLLSSISSPNAMVADSSTGTLAVTITNAVASTDIVTGVLTHLGGTAIFNFVTSLIVYAVAIEIGIRYLFTPLAIADLYSEKTRSSGFNWLKKLLAVSLQGAIIFLIIYGSAKLKNADGVNALAVNLCTLGMLAGSKLIANEIVGAH